MKPRHPSIIPALRERHQVSMVGPLGFEPRTDGLKVSGSSFKTAGNAGKQQENAGKTQISGRQTGHFRYKMATMATPKKGGNSDLRPRAHTCANIATVRALAAVNQNASTLAPKRAPCLLRWSRHGPGGRSPPPLCLTLRSGRREISTARISPAPRSLVVIRH